MFLSGGNQQKVVLAKWLLSDADIIILDEPTRGIDVGAKREIYEIINELVAEKKVVIVVSSDMEEVIGICDRIIVMHRGKAAMQGTPKEIFSHVEELEQMGLAAPQVSYVFAELKKRGYDVPTDVYTVKEAKEVLLKLVKQVKS